MLEPVPKPVIYHHRDSSVWLLDVANKHSHGHLAMDKTERCCQRNRQSHSLLGRLTHLAPPDAAPSQPRLVFKSARGNYYGDLRWMGGMSHIHVFNKNNKHSCLPQKAPLWKWIYHRGRARQLRLSHRGCRCLFCWYFCRRCSHNDFTYSHSSHSRLGLRRHSMWKRKGFFSFFIYLFFCTFVFVKVKRQLAFSCLEPDGEIGVHEHFWDNIHREKEIQTTNYKPSSFCYTANLLVMLCTWTTLRKCRAKALTGLTDLGLEKLGFPVREKKRGKKYERFNVTF